MLSVLIVEDQYEFQMYLNTIVNSDPELRNLGIIRQGQEAMKVARRMKPDIVIMDIRLPDMSGIRCIELLKPKCPDTHFIVCTVFEEDDYIFEAIKAGASGYILKRDKPYQIIDALKEARQGGFPISGSIARKILNFLPKEDPLTHLQEYALTTREHEILRFLAKGYTYDEIATHLYVSKPTLKWHVYRIYKKMHSQNRIEAVNKYLGRNEGMNNTP